MIKLLIQMLVVGFLVGIGKAADIDWYFILPAVLVAFLIVHFVWEALFPDPFLYLGARSIDPDDPLMIAAKQKAIEELAQFAEVFKKRPDASMVKFAFQTDQGDTEYLWGDLLELTDTNAKVFLRTPPLNHQGSLEREMTVSRDTIIDWQVEFPDGTLRGGYTNLALFKIYEREEGAMHPKFLDQVARFKSLSPDDVE